MAGILQLCRHLRFILHTPIRLFDSAGSLAAPDDAEENQEDPLECDRSFMRTLLSLRQEDRPVLHYESGSVLYAIIPAEDGQTIVAGPVCYVRDNATWPETSRYLPCLLCPHGHRAGIRPAAVSRVF